MISPRSIAVAEIWADLRAFVERMVVGFMRDKLLAGLLAGPQKRAHRPAEKPVGERDLRERRGCPLYWLSEAWL